MSIVLLVAAILGVVLLAQGAVGAALAVATIVGIAWIARELTAGPSRPRGYAATRPVGKVDVPHGPAPAAPSLTDAEVEAFKATWRATNGGPIVVLDDDA